MRSYLTAFLMATVLICSLFCSVPGGYSQEEQESPYSISVEADVYSKYLWRGSVLTDGPVFQPSISLCIKDFSFNIWANMDLDDANDNENNFSELDFTFEYSLSYDKLTFTGGFVQYTLPNTELEDTQEVYLKTEADVLLSPSLSVIYDLKEANGTYVSLDLGHSTPFIKFSEKATCELSLNAGVGWGSTGMNDYIFGVAEEALTDFHGGVSMPVTILADWCIEPSIIFSSVIDDELQDAVDDTSNIAFGLKASYVF
jgi:hypothetical protein